MSAARPPSSARAAGAARPASAAAFVLALVCAAALSACGAQPPQAPSSEANRVASALEGIELACGESAQQRALPGLAGTAPRSRAPEQEARRRALELARVVRRNPAWVYQGSKLSEVASSATSRLRECGLGGAAQPLTGAG